MDRQLHCLVLRVKTTTSNERAETFRTKTEDVLLENKHMRKEIDVLRNSDRVLVNLRDTLDNLQKHHRMRSAHIRQKDATILLIRKRCAEQRHFRMELVDQMGGMCDQLSAVAEERYERERLTQNLQTQPLLCMLALVRHDQQAEECIVQKLMEIQDLEKQSDESTLHLEQLQTEFAAATANLATSTEASAAALTEDWRVEKSELLAAYDALYRLSEEYQFHLRRGSNIKGTAQLTSEDALQRQLVELTLTLERDRAAVLALKGAVAKEQSRNVELPPSFHRRETDAAAEWQQWRECRLQLEDAQIQWEMRYEDQQRRYREACDTNGGLRASPSRGGEERRDASLFLATPVDAVRSGAHGEGRSNSPLAARSPSAASTNKGLDPFSRRSTPVKFTSASLGRLQSLTSSRKSYAAVEADDARLRQQRRDSMMNSRPRGGVQSPARQPSPRKHQ